MAQRRSSGLLWHQSWYGVQGYLVYPSPSSRLVEPLFGFIIPGSPWPPLKKLLVYTLAQEIGVDFGYQKHLSFLEAYLLYSRFGVHDQRAAAPEEINWENKPCMAAPTSPSVFDALTYLQP
jgi:hypothetical protein